MRLPLVFAVLTAVCWGLYGPALAESRAELKSPFKPYVAIGLAYLVWGVLGGMVGMASRGDSFSFTGSGSLWGFVAGTLGAWGAFTLTLAMFTGGYRLPHVVMSIVFGGAVTVAALVSVWRTSGEHGVSPWLFVGIAGILVCAVIVAVNTPHETPSGPAGTPKVAASVGLPPQDVTARQAP